MASVFADLWESIFIPGPTLPLLRAANGTFAALQLLLAALLLGTGSLHFVVLSLLSAALWWSVNWFAAELAASQRQAGSASEGAKGLPELDSAGDGSRGSGAEETASSRSPRLGTLRQRPTPGGELSLAKPQPASPELRPKASPEDEWVNVSSGERDQKRKQ